MSEAKKEPDSPVAAAINFGVGVDAGIVIVRQIGKSVALCVSVRSNGDAEALLDLDSAKKLLETMSRAVDRASRS